jgi:hypothetical protein
MVSTSTKGVSTSIDDADVSKNVASKSGIVEEEWKGDISGAAVEGVEEGDSRGIWRRIRMLINVLTLKLYYPGIRAMVSKRAARNEVNGSGVRIRAKRGEEEARLDDAEKRKSINAYTFQNERPL